MIWDVLICALWCVGILGLVWVLAGWFLLPLSGRQLTVIFPEERPGALERQLRTIEWLRAAGLSLLAEFGAAICRDSGEAALSVRIEVAARLALAAMAAPLLLGVVERALALL